MYNYQAPAHLLANKVILVTGAGDGIGHAAAVNYAALGATVILLGRTASKLEQTYDDIVAQGFPEPAIIPLDLNTAKTQQYNSLCETIVSEFGALHGLLHNAAILGPQKTIDTIPEHQWHEVIQVNLTATYLLTKAMLPALTLADNASIIMTTSSVGRQGRAFWGAYAVSKFGVEGLCQVLADELEKTSTVRVNCINPKATNTSMRRNAYPSEHPDSNPNPEDIMPLYNYLMSDDSIGVNGQSLDAR